MIISRRSILVGSIAITAGAMSALGAIHTQLRPVTRFNADGSMDHIKGLSLIKKDEIFSFDGGEGKGEKWVAIENAHWIDNSNCFGMECKNINS